MRFWKAWILGNGARLMATTMTSWLIRCTTEPESPSAPNEQPGQPSSQSGPIMKCWTRSWLRPANRSASVSLPVGPSNT